MKSAAELLQDCPPGTFPAGPVSASAPAANALPAGKAEELAGNISPISQRAASRVLLAAGALSVHLSHPDIIFFEQLWRRLPEQGIHSGGLSPARPLTLDLGAFRVAGRQEVWLFNLRPDIYKFSGLDPNDYVPVEPRRFSGQVGWDPRVNGQRLGNTYFELQPMPRQQQQSGRTTGPGTIAPAAEFAAARANAFARSAGAGTGLQPQRHERYGPEELPLTVRVTEGATFTAAAVVFRPITTPIAFFEFDMAGVILPSSLAATILDAIKPRMA